MTEQTAYIVGSGGQARVVASFLPHRRIRHLVEQNPGADDLTQNDFFALAEPPEGHYFLAIGDNQVRRWYFNRLKTFGVTLSSCIAPTAWIAETAHVGEGVFIGAGAVVGPGARVGENALINNLSLLEHDSHVGEDSHLAPGVIVGAELSIGRGCFLGMRSCVVSRTNIGDQAFVMAGAVVVRPVPAGARVGGVPARIMPDAPHPNTAAKT